MLPNVFILSTNGEILIEKQWEGRVKRSTCESLFALIARSKDRVNASPVNVIAKHATVHIRRCELYFVTVLFDDVSPLIVVELLHRIVDILLEYFSDISETTCRENFSTILQLFDEMVDGSFVVNMEPSTLKDLVQPPSLTRQLLSGVTGELGTVSQSLPTGQISKIPWRRTDIKYVTNEIYFDIVECIDQIIDPSQTSVLTAVSPCSYCSCSQKLIFLSALFGLGTYRCTVRFSATLDSVECLT